MSLQRYIGLRRTGFRRNKFHARPVHDIETGQSFDSTTEHRRWGQLQILERAGHISSLTLHPKIVLIPKRGKAPEIAFHPDFSYVEDGRTIWEDSKARPMTARDTLIFKLWMHYGPGLLRVTGAHGELKKQYMPEIA